MPAASVRIQRTPGASNLRIIPDDGLMPGALHEVPGGLSLFVSISLYGMPRHKINRYLPSPDQIRAMPGLGRLAPRLANPALWHLNRRTASQAVAWGLFCAILPIPMQSVLAAFGAIYGRFNLPVCIVMVWLSNPITALPILATGYWLGSVLLHEPMIHLKQLMPLLTETLNFIIGNGKPDFLQTYGRAVKVLVTGLLIEATLAALIGGLLTRLLWRCYVIYEWRKRSRRLSQPDQDQR